MAHSLTDMFVKNLKPEAKEYTRREKGGFGLRVLPSGRKVFFYMYRIDGQRRFLNLGSYKTKENPDGITLAEAREDYDAERAKVKALKAGRADGVDPLEQRKKMRYEREELSKASTVSELIDDYIEKCAKVKRKKSWPEDERILNKDVRPLWNNMKAKVITRRDVMQLLDGMQGRGDGIITNTFKVIRRMFAHAAKKEIITTTPCYSFDRGDELPRMVSRERNLSSDEIKVFWLGLDKAAISEDIQRILKLILLTGQRSGEVAAMHRNEISGRWWEFTPKETKITSEIPRKQRVYLTDTALELIGEGEGYVFKCKAKPKPETEGIPPEPRHITERAISHAVRRNLLDYEPKKKAGVKTSSPKLKRKKPFVVADDKKMNIAHFTPHDLRRSCATLISELGFTDATVDAILAHLKKGEIRTYNKNKYDREKQLALESWDRRLHSIITGEKGTVIPMQRKEKSQ